jgi:hypothetical protein
MTAMRKRIPFVTLALLLLTFQGEAAAQVPCPQDVRTLENNQPVQVSVQLGCDLKFRVVVPANSGQITVFAHSNIRTTPELYLRAGSMPTQSDWLCKRDDGLCEISGHGRPITAGEWFVRISGESPGVEMIAVVSPMSAPDPVITKLRDGVPLTRQSAAEGETLYYEVHVPVGTRRLTVTTGSGQGTSDLWVGRGVTAWKITPECRNANVATDMQCDITNPVAGTYYVQVRGRPSYSGLTITARTGSPATPAVAGAPAAAKTPEQCATEWKPRLAGRWRMVLPASTGTKVLGYLRLDDANGYDAEDEAGEIIGSTQYRLDPDAATPTGCAFNVAGLGLMQIMSFEPKKFTLKRNSEVILLEAR